MRQLDENAPVKTLGAWKAESSKGDAKQAAQATSVLVWYVKTVSWACKPAAD